ncbi:MAG: InlB B-repeat-containing protein [Oscillospiraceae bacterium]|nr:InlB B-repeat-containing protein [Oscillospiraceae bacterium]
MKKMTKRALSLLLTLAMILSLGVLPASAAGIDEAEEIDAAYPAQQFSYYEPGGLNIDVKAPAGALPRGTTMEVSRLANLAPVQDAVDRAEDLDGAVVLAADISFWHEGEEVEPVDGNKILVTMTAPEIAEVLDPVVVHVPDEEPAVAERIDPIVDDSLDIVAMGDQISFEAEKFSVYAVIGGSTGDEARVEVNFYNNHLQGNKKVVTLYVKNSDTADEIEKIVYDPGIGELLPRGLLFLGWSIDDPNANTAVEGKDYDTEHYGADYNLNTRVYDIDGVRDYLESLSITEGMDPINIYAMVVRIYVVTYLDKEGVSLGSDDVLMNLSETSAPYTITMGYTPLNQDENFEGWNLSDGIVANAQAENEDGDMVAVEAPYPVGTTMTISSDVTFSVNAPKGHWLVFEEVQKGATYNAPVFIYEGKAADADGKRPAKSLPENMKCAGYTFLDWYEAETDENGVVQKDDDGNVILKSSPFDWSTVITKRTVLYAKWDVASTATYTVIVWKQSVVDDKNAADAAKTYDFGLSAQLTGTPGTNVADLVSTDLAAYLGKDGGSIDGVTLFGFKQNTTQVAKANSGNKTIGNGIVANSEKIAANGTTVINIYYDRELVTYTFSVYELTAVANSDVPSNFSATSPVYFIYYEDEYCPVRYYSGTYTDIYKPTTSNSGTQYGIVDGVWTSLEYRYFNGYGYLWVYNNGGSYSLYNGIRYYHSDTISGTSYYFRTSNRLDYAPYYTYQWRTLEDRTMTGLFGQKLSKYGYVWPLDYRWMLEDSSNPGTPSSTSFSSIEEMFLGSTNYYGRTEEFNATVSHYLQNVDGSWPETATYTVATNTTSYMSFKSFAGFSSYQFRIKIADGRTNYWYGHYSDFNNSYPHSTDANGWTDWLDSGNSVKGQNGYDSVYTNEPGDYQWHATEGGIEFRYERETYKLNFMVGKFVNGNMEEQPTNAVAGLPKTVTDIAYEASLASYAEGGDDYFDPFTNAANAQLAEEYVFDGWYVDDACTQKFDFANATMPLDGVTVYGKWIQKQYRVFLHPNAFMPEGSNDPNLDWGSDSQSLNFRISYGGTLSAPNPRRDVSGYEFIGWYTDPECKNAFNLETKLTDDTVNTPYDKTVDMTDPMDKYGEGATWNSDIIGYNGGDRFWITTKLDLYGKWGATLSGAPGIAIVYDANGGSGAPTDSRYYKDNVDAIAQAASIPADAEKDQFLYWVMQKWDSDQSKYVDIPGSKIYPGDTFTVLKSNSKIVIINSHTDGDKVIIDEATYTLQLRAEYGPKEVETPTHIYWYANNETSGVQKDENIQINKGVDIPTTETWTNGTRDGSGLTYEGHEFLGWARLETSDTVDPATLCYDDLFLRWVGDHYEAKNDSGAWVPVTQVACDERTLYHNMYAVWAKVFYVYHSGTNVVEKVVINSTAVTETNGTTARTPVTFNLAGRTSAGFLYGGYYTDYAGKSANFDAKLVAEASWTAGDAAAAASANARAIYTYTDNGTGVKAYDGTNASWSGAYTDRADTLTPVAGKTYYIKEVPAAKYLRPQLRYTYFENTEGSIANIWLITNLDDDTYIKSGLVIADTIIPGTVTDSLTITPRNKPVNAQTHTSQSLFKTAGKLCYLEVMAIDKPQQADLTGDFLQLLQPGQEVLQYWVTPDGMKVTGTVMRAYKGLYTKSEIDLVADYPQDVDSTIVYVGLS